MTDEERKRLYWGVGGLVVGALLAWLFFGQRGRVAVPVAQAESDAQAAPVVNGQIYYNVGFQTPDVPRGFNSLADEYFPLFGFVGTHAYL